MKKIIHWPSFWIAAAVAVASVASNLATGQSEKYSPATGSAEESNGGRLLREGMRLDGRRITCRSAGDRLVIELPDEGRTLLALENLAAQRILKAVLDDATDSHWIADGHVTEFQDRNYVLLERVIRAAKE